MWSGLVKTFLFVAIRNGKAPDYPDRYGWKNSLQALTSISYPVITRLEATSREEFCISSDNTVSTWLRGTRLDLSKPVK